MCLGLCGEAVLKKYLYLIRFKKVSKWCVCHLLYLSAYFFICLLAFSFTVHHLLSLDAIWRKFRHSLVQIDLLSHLIPSWFLSTWVFLLSPTCLLVSAFVFFFVRHSSEHRALSGITEHLFLIFFTREANRVYLCSPQSHPNLVSLQVTDFKLKLFNICKANFKAWSVLLW